MLVGAANALAAERRPTPRSATGIVDGGTGACYDIIMKKRIAMDMGFEFRFITLNEAISFANVREHLLRN